MGTVSLLGRKRAVMDEQLFGNRLSFTTRSQQTIGAGDTTRDVIYHYTGLIAGDRVAFTLRSEGGFLGHIPVTFMAQRTKRVLAKILMGVSPALIFWIATAISLGSRGVLVALIAL
tara:strand:+ start:17885 stop:18232 length:348 start_codon:yes stop_codon:yes gene_type:complete